MPELISLYKPKYGQLTELVKWENTAAGWMAITVRGNFCGQTSTTITLRYVGVKHVYSRPEWEYVIA